MIVLLGLIAEMTSSIVGSYSFGRSLREMTLVYRPSLLNPSRMRFSLLIQGAICSRVLRFFLYLRRSSARCQLLNPSSRVSGKQIRIASHENGTILLSGSSMRHQFSLSCSHCLWTFSAFHLRIPVRISSSFPESESA